MQIVIIGGDLSGLLTYISLRTHLASLDPNLSIKILESAKGPADLPDGSCSLPPNALRSIQTISPSLALALRERSYSDGGVINILNSNGEVLGEYKAGTKEKYGDLQHIVVSYKVFRELLLAMVDEVDVKWDTSVSGLVEVDGGVEVAYADSGREVVDLVIGADGVGSVVKEALFKGEYANEFRYVE